MAPDSKFSKRAASKRPRADRWTFFWLATCFCFFTACVLFMERTKQLKLENQQLNLQAVMILQDMLENQTCSMSSAQTIETALEELRSSRALLSGDLAACLRNPGGPVPTDQAEEKPALVAADVLTRVMVGLLLVGGVTMTYLTLKNIDDLPEWLNKWATRSLLGEENAAKKQGDKKVPLSKLLEYQLDQWFSTNPYSKTLALLYITLVMIVIGGLGIFTLSTISLDDALWEAIVGVGLDWTFPSDAAPEDQDTSLRVIMVRFMGLMVSVGGMLVTALMLGIVSDAIGDKVDQMKKGKSEVLESGHTLILGWSDKLFGTIKELANANESIGGSAIVVLSEKDKEEMEEDIADQEIDMRGSRVICRTGNPLLSLDLHKVSVQTARSIIILAQQLKSGTNADVADAFTLRIVMSLMSIHQKQPGGLNGHIVAEVCDLDNEPLLKMVTSSHHLETVVAHDIIGRLMIQSRRQPGLAAVWEDLLGFDDNEFYSQSWPELTGKTFSEVLLSFPDAVPIGVVQGDDVCLNPTDDYVLQESDELLVLAEDDDTYSPAPAATVMLPQIMPDYQELPIKERILFLGWRRDMDDMIMVLDEFVVEGSELWLYSDVPLDQRAELLRKGGMDPDTLKNLQLIYDVPEMCGEVTDRISLRKVAPERFSTILILADENNFTDEMADADSRALATLLLVREIQAESVRASTGASLPSTPTASLGLTSGSSVPWYQHLKQHKAVSSCIVISEILDSRTRHLISELNISEYVLSNEIISMALAMVSENAAVNQILRELFTEDGNELYVHSATRYLFPGESVSFFDLMSRARENAEIVIGYKAKDRIRPILNPPDKSTPILSLENVAYVVVLAEQDFALEMALKDTTGRLTPRASRSFAQRNSRKMTHQNSSLCPQMSPGSPIIRIPELDPELVCEKIRKSVDEGKLRQDTTEM